MELAREIVRKWNARFGPTFQKCARAVARPMNARFGVGVGQT
jgi:hypothetical protein